jgi:microcystin-dependent protein
LQTQVTLRSNVPVGGGTDGAGTGISINGAGTGISIAANGSNGGHNNLQPYQTFNYIIRT